MFGNGQVFISHTHQDNDLCDQLTAALDVWEVDYWIDLQQLSAGQELLSHIHKPLSERDIFIRVCTPAANASPWMDQEEKLAETLRAPNRSGRRLLINLVLAPGYRLSESERQAQVIDGTADSQEGWIQRLRQILEIPAPGSHMNRRMFIGVGATSVAALTAVTVAGKLLLTPPAIPGYRPVGPAHKTTPQQGAGASKVLWRYALGTSLSLQGTGLAVEPSGMYGASVSALFSLRLADGALRWQQLPPGFSSIPSQTAPTLVGDTLYTLASGFPTFALLATNAHDGSLRWQANLESNENLEIFRTAPVTAASNTIVVQYNTTTAAVDSTTHSLLWKVTQPPPNSEIIDATPNSDQWAAPAITGDTVVAGLSNGNCYAYTLSSGAPVWSFTQFVGRGAPIQSTPAVVNGIAYFGRNDGFCYAVEAQSGALIWKTELGAGIVGVSSPQVVDGVVYLAAGSGAGIFPEASQADDVFALDAQTGKVRWHTHPSQAVQGGQLPAYTVISQPLLVDGTLYMTASLASVSWTRRDVLYALDSSDGSVKWYYLVAGQGTSNVYNNFPSAPVAYNHVVYFVSSDATVYALSLQ